MDIIETCNSQKHEKTKRETRQRKMKNLSRKKGNIEREIELKSIKRNKTKQ